MKHLLLLHPILQIFLRYSIQEFAFLPIDILPLNVWSSESYHACMNGRVTTNEDEVKSYASMKVLIIVGQVYHL